MTVTGACMSDERETSILHRGEEFLQIFKKGAEFTQELLRENERLRYRNAALEEEARSRGDDTGGPPEVVEVLRTKASRLEAELEKIHNRFREVEAENQDFAQRYVEIEEENNNLANLYIASFQLHSTLNFKEVLQIILEIVINLIGAEQFGVLLLDEKTDTLSPVASEGIEVSELPSVILGQGIIGQVAQSGENFIAKDLGVHADLLNPLVCIPLKIKDHIIGVLVLYKLLEQKSQFADVDYELFTLLAGHAATAIFSSRMYSESERKLSTIQGFMNLLTK
jgi:transcriptional regulator with GAF, ATPase, and Fis domain